MNPDCFICREPLPEDWAFDLCPECLKVAHLRPLSWETTDGHW